MYVCSLLPYMLNYITLVHDACMMNGKYSVVLSIRWTFFVANHRRGETKKAEEAFFIPFILFFGDTHFPSSKAQYVCPFIFFSSQIHCCKGRRLRRRRRWILLGGAAMAAAASDQQAGTAAAALLNGGGDSSSVGGAGGGSGGGSNAVAKLKEEEKKIQMVSVIYFCMHPSQQHTIHTIKGKPVTPFKLPLLLRTTLLIRSLLGALLWTL